MQNMSAMATMTFSAAWKQLYTAEVRRLSSGTLLIHGAWPSERMAQEAINTALALDVMNINT